MISKECYGYRKISCSFRQIVNFITIRYYQVHEEDEVDWVGLDDLTWHEIFTFLDGTSLLRAAETCKKFNDVLKGSKVLLGKLKIVIEFPDYADSDEVKAFSKRLITQAAVQRPYQRLEISRLRNGHLHPESKKLFNSLITRLATTIVVIKLDHCHILRDDVIKLLQRASQLRELYIANLMFSDDLPANDGVQISCPHLKTLHIGCHCDFTVFIMLKSNANIESLVIKSPEYSRPDVEAFENFLLGSPKLKELSLSGFRFNSSYSTNRLAAVPFKLETLKLSNVNWDIPEHCLKFLQSQTGLKTFELSAFSSWVSDQVWFNDAMSCVFARNSAQLRCVRIDSRGSSFDIKDVDFLPEVVNNKVTSLHYIKGHGDKSELFQALTRVFPKVKTLEFNDAFGDSASLTPLLQRFKELESLELTMIPKALEGCQELSSHLKTFNYRATNEHKAAETLSGIFTRHPSIQNVSLNIEPLTIEEITGLILALSQSLETLSISDLHMNSTEAQMFADNFPRLRQIRADLRLNQEVIEILKVENIKFCLSNERSKINDED